MRILTPIEQNRLKILTENSISATLIEPTRNGLKKSIMDATGSVRNYLKEKNIHDYSLQTQGPSNKVLINAEIINEFSIKKSIASLYRPITKSGDPRIWFTGLPKFTAPNDILALIAFEKKIYVVNLTTNPLEKLIDSAIANPFKDLVNAINNIENAIAVELLNKLKEISSLGFIPASVNADTAVGRTLETALGIAINSSKNPDYKGIELKSYRDNKSNRKNLFAQVPDWESSNFKSSAQILDAFGYQRDEDFKLYCTVSTLARNSQGLKLRLDTDMRLLVENSDRATIGDFVVWCLEMLHKRLLEKHNETFWIAADSQIIDGKEHFIYKKVMHTKKPIISQFDILLEQGIITLDHLIKRSVNGKVVEKGPLFKIKPNGINLLFPPSQLYLLQNN